MYTANMEDLQDVDHMAEAKSSHLTRIVQPSVLDSFSKLESNVDNHRITAGVTLLRSLYQKQCESENESSCREIIYSLKRLIRGLATSNQYKRSGFFSVLVEMLNLFPCISFQDVMSIVDKELALVHNCSKKELTEVHSGQVLVIGALIHSNFLFVKGKNAQGEVLARLISAGQKKSLLIPSVYSFLLDFIEKTDEENFRVVVWPLLEPELNKTWEEHTLDSFHLLLEVRKRFPGIVKRKFLVRTLGSKELFSEDSIASCSKLLMKPTFALKHPVYEVVCQNVILADSTFSFWESLVRENTKHPNQQKEQRLLYILSIILQQMPDKTQIPKLLCDSFMEMVIKTFQTKRMKADLAKQTNELFSKMSTFLESDEIDDKFRIQFIQHILFYPGHMFFDKLAGTNFFVNLSSHLKSEGVRTIGKMLRNVISAHEPKVKNALGETCLWNKWERSYAAQLFTRLLDLPIMEENTKWKFKQLKFLISVGFIASPSREPGDIANSVVAYEVRNCIFKVLDQKVSKIDQSIKLLTSVVYHLHEILFEQKNPLKLRQPLTDSSITAWKKMVSIVREIGSSEDDSIIGKQSGKHMFLILFLHMGLQLFQNAALAGEALEELHCCYEKTKISNLKSKQKKGKSDDDKEDEPFWADVIVDLLLSLLSRNSHLLRHIVAVIFPHLCPHLTTASVHQIVEVLDPHGKQPLSSTDTEEDSEDDTNEEGGTGEDGEEESGSEDDDDDDDDDYSENAPVDVHVKMAVQNALKKAGVGYTASDEESVDMDTMTTKERNALDAALSEAFKLLQHNQADQKRKKQSKDDETLMHFRVRVMDLIDVFLSNQPALALVLDVILPLFELLEFCIKDDHQKPLENRVRNCLRKLSGVKHFSNVLGVDQVLLSVVLRRLLQKGERASAVYQNMGEPLVQCSTFLARTSHYLAQQESDTNSMKICPVLNIFEEALTSFFQQRDSLLPMDVFKSVLAITWKGAWKLAEAILNFTFNVEVRPFRRHQALRLLVSFFSNSRLFIDAPAKYLKKLEVMEKKLSEDTVNVLTKVVKGKEKKDTEVEAVEVKEKHIKELLRLLFAIWQAHNRCKGNGLPCAIDWAAVKTVVSQYWEMMTLTTDTKTALKRLASVLRINMNKKTMTSEEKKLKNAVTAMEDDRSEGRNGVNENGDLSHDSGSEGSDSDGSDDDTGDKGYESGNDIQEETHNKKAKKRKRPKADNLKGKALLKKQCKEARLAAMASGLDDSVSFAALSFADLEKLKTETEDSAVVRKKKKKHSSGVEEINNSSDECSDVPGPSKKSKIKSKEVNRTSPKRKKHKVSQ